MLSDPAAAAWIAAGRPAVDAPTPVPGRCGRCGEDGPTVTSSRIVSEKFSGFDAWPFGFRRLCVACAWAYSHPPTTQLTQLITTTTVTKYANAAELAPVLTAGPLPATHAALVPSSRRRHILPTTQWGHLATDTIVIAWDATAARRLADLAWLRATLRATWSQLGEPWSKDDPWTRLSDPVPPPELLTSQPADLWPTILRAWASVRPWQTIPPLWSAARSLTNDESDIHRANERRQKRIKKRRQQRAAAAEAAAAAAAESAPSPAEIS